jgi:hypothetical protein
MKEVAVMRDGRYAIYNGKKYEFDRDSDGQYYLSSTNSKDIKNGFYKIDENYYRKDVKKDEVESIFAIDTFCRYKGYEFQADEAKGEKILIRTSNVKAYEDKELGLDMIGRGEYQKLIDRAEATEIYEKKAVLFKNEEKKSRKETLGALDTFKKVISPMGLRKKKSIDTPLPTL